VSGLEGGHTKPHAFVKRKTRAQSLAFRKQRRQNRPAAKEAQESACKTHSAAFLLRTRKSSSQGFHSACPIPQNPIRWIEANAMPGREPKNLLSPKQRDKLLAGLENRFLKHANRHPGVAWADVESRLRSAPGKLWSLHEMERNGGNRIGSGKTKAPAKTCW